MLYKLLTYLPETVSGCAFSDIGPSVQISDSRLTLLLLNANLKVTCFCFYSVIFSRFIMTIVICYCTLFYIVIGIH